MAIAGTSFFAAGLSAAGFSAAGRSAALAGGLDTAFLGVSAAGFAIAGFMGDLGPLLTGGVLVLIATGLAFCVIFGDAVLGAASLTLSTLRSVASSPLLCVGCKTGIETSGRGLLVVGVAAVKETVGNS